ncbi:MAG TPA: hypothetical protein VE442_18545 [Jatrophihabitans sp.]|jgi:hypothetical protein|nr:hypothetical protein [Jatrophihabitans sp.]
MSSTFHYELAKEHADALLRAADRLVREAGARGRTTTRARCRRLIVGGVAVVAAAGASYATAASAATPSHAQPTPSQCTPLHRTAYNDCHVGNSGRGDLQYRPVRSQS